MGGLDQDPRGGPESRLWAAVVERGQEPGTALPDEENCASNSPMPTERMGEQHCCERPDRSPGWTAAKQGKRSVRGVNGPPRRRIPGQTKNSGRRRTSLEQTLRKRYRRTRCCHRCCEQHHDSLPFNVARLCRENLTIWRGIIRRIGLRDEKR